MPIVTHFLGIASIAPFRSPIALATRVSRLMVSTRVCSAANSSGVSSSCASLKARWPLMPMPPKAMSTPPRRSISRAMAPVSCGSGKTRCASGISSSGSIFV